MPQPNDLSRSLVALDQDSTIIAVVEMSQSSWLVAGMLPGIERQPRKKLEPSAERLLGSFFVKEFKQELETTFGQPMEFLERNMSAYNNVEQTFADIVLDVMVASMTRRSTLLFIDEIDTELDEKNMFQRLIAPMNGDPFFF